MSDAQGNRAVMAVLAYLWPLAFIPLVMQKDDPEVQWHAKHGLVLAVSELILMVVLGIVTSVMSLSLATLGVGCMLSVFMLAIWAAILVLHAIAILKALNGKRLIIPGVSGIADRW